MKHIRRTLLSLALVAVSAVPAAAQTAPAVKLESIARIEVTQTDAQGKQTTVFKTPGETQAPPGTFVSFTLNYNNAGPQPAANFIATNPMPTAVSFVSVAEDWAEVSVDGGKTFGKLAALTVTSAPTDGTAAVSRAATAADVTTVRWAFKTPIPAGATGKLSYRGVIK